MLNARNVVVAMIVIAVVSILGACLSFLQSPGSSGLGVDSFGVHGHGFRGLFEILEELRVPVERANLPPDRLLNREVTLTLLQPNADLTSTEPAYLRSVAAWIRQGGCAVVSPPFYQPHAISFLPRAVHSKGPLAELGLNGVRVSRIKGTQTPKSKQEDESLTSDAEQNARHVGRLLFDRLAVKPGDTVHATVEGELAARFPQGLELVLPRDNVNGIEETFDSSAADDKSKLGDPKRPIEAADDPLPLSRVRVLVDPQGKPETLAAIYRVGQGTIAVLADPRLAQNGLIGQADNAVLVTHLLADFGRPVVFDEFYHGLTVRGNPLWLLSRFPYGWLALAALAASLLLGWRQARFLGPPLEAPAISRRTLAEYIEAMARLLNRSRNAAPFILNEIRQGLFWRVRHDWGLPPGPDDAALLVQRLARRDPVFAEKLRDALASLDDVMKNPAPRSAALAATLKKVSICVSRPVVRIGP